MNSAILNCCMVGDVELLREKISSLDSPDELLQINDEYGKSLTSVAATFGHLLILEELLKIGASLDGVSVRGYTALHWAASWGHLEIVKYLVNAGARLDTKTVHKETPRVIAERYQKEECAEYLRKSEKFEELKNLAIYYKEIVNDIEKNLGRFNKEDKLYGNRYCDDKIDWVETNRDMASLSLINSKIDELKNQMKNSMAKLED